MCELLSGVCAADCSDVLGMTEQMLAAKISFFPPLSIPQLYVFLSFFAILISTLVPFALFLHHCVSILFAPMSVSLAFFNSLPFLPRIGLYLLPALQLYLLSLLPISTESLVFPHFFPK